MAAEDLDPPTTPWEIREAVRREVGWWVEQQGLDGTPSPGGVNVDDYAKCAAVLRDLCAALEATDRVAFNAQQAMTAAPPFDVEVLAVQLWNASQEAGGSTSVGDAVVAELRKAVSA